MITSYDFTGRTFVVTGGGGVLGGEIAMALAAAGANVAVLDLSSDAAEGTVGRMGPAAARATALACNVLDVESLGAAAGVVRERFGVVDGLVNAAGGNHPSATTRADQSFFDIPTEALRFVCDLNLLGTVLPCQVFGRAMAEQGAGAILNIASINSLRPLTRIPAYSAGKAGVASFTQWLAVHLAQEYSPRLRVNALAPGFFLTAQNRFLLTDPDSGALTPRGETILAHTPMGRFGDPQDLVGAALWLLSPASAFVTGIVVPIDGGFTAYAGV